MYIQINQDSPFYNIQLAGLAVGRCFLTDPILIRASILLFIDYSRQKKTQKISDLKTKELKNSHMHPQIQIPNACPGIICSTVELGNKEIFGFPRIVPNAKSSLSL